MITKRVKGFALITLTLAFIFVSLGIVATWMQALVAIAGILASALIFAGFYFGILWIIDDEKL